LVPMQLSQNTRPRPDGICRLCSARCRLFGLERQSCTPRSPGRSFHDAGPTGKPGAKFSRPRPPVADGARGRRSGGAGAPAGATLAARPPKEGGQGRSKARGLTVTLYAGRVVESAQRFHHMHLFRPLSFSAARTSRALRRCSAGGYEGTRKRLFKQRVDGCFEGKEAGRPCRVPTACSGARGVSPRAQPVFPAHPPRKSVRLQQRVVPSPAMCHPEGWWVRAAGGPRLPAPRLEQGPGTEGPLDRGP